MIRELIRCKLRFSLSLVSYLHSTHTPSLRDNESTVTSTNLLPSSFLKLLGNAYTQYFIGEYATKFINHLEQADGKVDRNELNLYAKAISVVQSSGTGKSRMLTEVRPCFGW